MQELLDFILAHWWVTRDNCGWWTPTMVAIYAISNLWIWISYERIPRELSKLADKGITIFDEKNSKGFVESSKPVDVGIYLRTYWFSFGHTTCSLCFGICGPLFFRNEP